MKITQDVREYAQRQGIESEQALKQGLEDKGKEFLAKGSEIYLKV
jgi:phosphomethylpyrimidine synthase